MLLTLQEEERVEDAREQKNTLLKLGRGNLHDGFTPQAQPKPTSTHALPQPRVGGGAAQHPQGSKTTATVLLTQLASHLGVSSPQAGGQATQVDRAPRNWGQPLPAHLKVSGDANANKLFCRGCNNIWDRTSAVPCYKGCKYSEHPDYNKNCREKDSTKTEPLTWKRFRERYPNVAIPQALLAWEEKERHFAALRASKRPRDETRHGA